MKRMITKANCINNITVFSLVTLTCILVTGVFVVKLLEDMEEGAALFIPGIIALFAGVLLVLIFSITRIIKYIRLLKQN